MSDDQKAPTPSVMQGGLAATAFKLWAQAYRVELALFVGCALVLGMFSSQRFLRQSAAPHFVYQSKAWLEGRLDIDPEVLPNFEDWACVRLVNGEPTRCTRPLQTTDKWFSSFPAFPSLLMLPFVALHGYQFNDTSFGVLLAALSVALFYSLLRIFREHEGTGHTIQEDAIHALLMGFGSLFFYAAIRGEVWFSAEVMGVGLSALYLRNAVGARRPFLAGLFWSMAVLTRTPLLFTGVFFVLEVLCPDKTGRVKQLQAFLANPKAKLEPFLRFGAGAAPLGLTAAFLNWKRFGSLSEFGHRFFFDNRVNPDIDTFGLFNLHYLSRNLDAAFLKLPSLAGNPPQLAYDPWGMSLFLTLPLLALMFVPATKPRQAWAALAAMGAVVVGSAMMPSPLQPSFPVGDRPVVLWVVLLGAAVVLVGNAWKWAHEEQSPRLVVPLLVTLAACAAPGLVYQNTGYAQFGFRFSIDYSPYLFALLAVGRWDFRKPLPLALAALSVMVNFWGAVAFRGYTELVRGWH